MGRLHLAPRLGAALLFLATHASAQTPADALAEAEACAGRNVPRETVDLRATFVKVDRVGGERESRARIAGKKLEDGLRRVVVRFDYPLEIRDTAMLMIEAANGPSDFYVWSPDERRVRRVLGKNPSGLFGTDFSYDDFENWRGFQKRGAAERLPDAVEAGRPVYVIQGKPAPEDGSSYERVVSFIDRASCVILRVDSYEPGGKLRKTLRADPARIEQVGALSLALAFELEDVIGGTRTRVKLEQVRLDTDLPDRKFRPTDLASGGE